MDKIERNFESSAKTYSMYFGELYNDMRASFPSCMASQESIYDGFSMHGFVVAFPNFSFIVNAFEESAGRHSCSFSGKIPLFVYKHVDKFIMRNRYGLEDALCIKYLDLKEILFLEGYGGLEK